MPGRHFANVLGGMEPIRILELVAETFRQERRNRTLPRPGHTHDHNAHRKTPSPDRRDKHAPKEFGMTERPGARDVKAGATGT